MSQNFNFGRFLQECLIVRRATSLPFVLDEVVDDVFSLMAVARDGAADVVNIKISKFGGLTRAKQAVDLCSELGIAMTIEGESQGARKLTLTY